MEFEKKISPTKLGNSNYINPNCWVAVTINGPPYERCRYCIKSYKQCPIFRYIIISLGLVSLSLVGIFFIERELWGSFFKIILFSDFIFVIVYGYFYNKVTVEVIKAEYEAKKILEIKIEQRTKELREAYGELKKLDKAKSEFISIASHQLRTPLSAIKGYISMMLEKSYGKPPTKMEEPLENIYASNERLIKLVNDLLNVSRIESGRMEMNFEKVALDEIITSVIEELKGAADKKSIYLKFEKPERWLPKVLVDRDKIRQVIMNVIDNAIRYTNDGGITIKLKTQNSKLKTIISDTGEGMAKEEISHLFESFSRGTAGTRFWTEGAGLGLYVAKKFVELHKGKIWAESKGRGKGSTFYIELSISQRR